jgi:ribonuclease BN (tRNA processing enzyme)
VPLARKERVRFVQRYHTGSDEVGKVAAQANVWQLALSHLIMAGASPQDLVADIAPSYSGKTTVGEDLMTFELAK